MSNELFTLMIMVVKHCSLSEEKIRKEFKLSLAEYNGLLALENGEKVLCNVFSKKMGLSPSRGSRVINRLIDKGYLRGNRLLNDKRGLIVSLSRKGKAIKAKLAQRMSECERKILKHLSAKKRKEVKEALRILAEVMAKEVTDAI